MHISNNIDSDFFASVVMPECVSFLHCILAWTFTEHSKYLLFMDETLEII